MYVVLFEILWYYLSIAVGCNSEPKYLLAGCNGF